MLMQIDNIAEHICHSDAEFKTCYHMIQNQMQYFGCNEITKLIDEFVKKNNHFANISQELHPACHQTKTFCQHMENAIELAGFTAFETFSPDANPDANKRHFPRTPEDKRLVWIALQALDVPHAMLSQEISYQGERFAGAAPTGPQLFEIIKQDLVKKAVALHTNRPNIFTLQQAVAVFDRITKNKLESATDTQIKTLLDSRRKEIELANGLQHTKQLPKQITEAELREYCKDQISKIFYNAARKLFSDLVENSVNQEIASMKSRLSNLATRFANKTKKS